MFKREIRGRLRKVLDLVPNQEVRAQSEQIRARIKELNICNKNVGCYLNMVHGEVVTDKIVEDLIDNNNRVYLPTCTDTSASHHSVTRVDLKVQDHLVFHKLKNLAELKSLKPSGKFQIREIERVGEYPQPPELDYLFIPGLGFDIRTGRRLGRGKGYYDDFITRYYSSHQKFPKLVGLSLLQQSDVDVPLEKHDKTMNMIITSNGVFNF